MVHIKATRILKETNTNVIEPSISQIDKLPYTIIMCQSPIGQTIIFQILPCLIKQTQIDNQLQLYGL